MNHRGRQGAEVAAQLFAQLLDRSLDALFVALDAREDDEGSPAASAARSRR